LTPPPIQAKVRGVAGDYQLPRQCKWGIGGNLNKIKMNLKSRMKRNREERLDGGVTWM